MPNPRDELVAELRANYVAGSAALGSAITALEASGIEAFTRVADTEMRQASLTTDGLQAMRIRVPGLAEDDRAANSRSRYLKFHSLLSASKTRMDQAIIGIDTPPGP